LHAGADRVLSRAEKPTRHGLPEQHDESRLGIIIGRDGAAGSDLPIGDRRIAGTDTLDRRRSSFECYIAPDPAAGSGS